MPESLATHQIDTRLSHWSQKLRRFAVGLAVLLATALFVHPLFGLNVDEARAAALLVLTIGFWATGILPEHLTSLWFMLLAMLLAVAPASEVFSGFSSPALWLVFSGLILGLAVDRTGLGARIAQQMAKRITHHYFALLGGLVGVGIVLSFLMPSSLGRVALLIPIALSVAGHAGFEPGSRGRTGVVLAAAFGCQIPAFAILTANVPNMVLVGSAETLLHVSPSYGEYLLLHFPVLGALKAIALVLLIAWLYPDRTRPIATRPPAARQVLSRDERLLALVLAITLTLWMTDSMNHLSPAWIALAAALILMLPRFGIISPQQFRQGINFNSLFFVAGVIGFGAIVSYTGLGARFAHLLAQILPLAPGYPLRDFASLTLVSLVTGIFTTLPGVPAVLTPLAGKMAAASGLSVKTVLMTQVLGFSTALFPYQSAPLVVAMQLAGESLLPTLRLLLALAVLSAVLLLPLDYLWWRALGWL